MRKSFRISCLGKKGLTLLEILAAVFIFSMGFLPLLKVLSESQRVTKISMAELQANGMVSSMIAGMKMVQYSKIISCLGKPLKDSEFPSFINFPNMGIPESPPGLFRVTTLRLINEPVYPVDRFSNPWEVVLEIDVSVYSNIFMSPPSDGRPGSSGYGKPVLRMKGFRILGKADFS